VVEALARRLVSAETVLVTALLGAGADGAARGTLASLASAHPDVEFDVHEGGQPFHALLLGAE
jgi:fatty acid kinase subunit A-like protein